MWLDAEDIGGDARPFLRDAWTTLLKNHPHDDICGCSIDAVHTDDEARFRRVEEACTELLTEHLEQLQKNGGFEPPPESGDRHTDVCVFNPHSFRQQVRVEATVLIPNPNGEQGECPSPRPLAGCAEDDTPLDVTVLNTEGDVCAVTTWSRRRYGATRWHSRWRCPRWDTRSCTFMRPNPGRRSRRHQLEPSIPTLGAQCFREMEAHLAFGTGPVSRSEAARYGRTFAHPAWARELPSLLHVESDEEHPRRRGLLHLDNPAVEMSAFRPTDEDDTRVLRLFNRTGEEQSVTVTFGVPVAAWCPTDFHEQWDDSKARL